MPKRQRTRKISSPQIQGDDSWVVIRELTIGEAKEIQSTLSGIEDPEAMNEKGLELFAQFIEDWNWVDDDGDPLPKPHEPGAFDNLLKNEFQFLVQILTNIDAQAADTKKKK